MPNTTDLPPLARLRASTEGLTPALARVAGFVLEHPERVIYQSITELAESAAASEATIMRFIRQLGFDGYARFRLALATDLAQRNAHERTASGSIKSVIAHMAETGIDALRETLSLQRTEQLDRVVEWLDAAPRIELYAVGNSTVVARHMAIKLLRAGAKVLHYDDPHLAVMTAGTMGPGDLAIAVSSSGATLDVLKPAAAAKEAGARLVAITNQRRSRLAALADESLIASNPEGPLGGGALPSKIGQMLIVDALVAMLLERAPARSREFARSAAAILDRSV